MEKPKSRGRPLGVYLKDDIIGEHEKLKGRKFYVKRQAPDGSLYRDIYEVPESLSAFVRDSVAHTFDLIGTWQEVLDK